MEIEMVGKFVRGKWESLFLRLIKNFIMQSVLDRKGMFD